MHGPRKKAIQHVEESGQKSIPQHGNDCYSKDQGPAQQVVRQVKHPFHTFVDAYRDDRIENGNDGHAGDQRHEFFNENDTYVGGIAAVCAADRRDSICIQAQGCGRKKTERVPYPVMPEYAAEGYGPAEILGDKAFPAISGDKDQHRGMNESKTCQPGVGLLQGLQKRSKVQVPDDQIDNDNRQDPSN